MISNNVCTECGSDRMGFLCGCGEIRCSCERDCPTCEAQMHFEEQQSRHEAEQLERAEFENRMDEKYGY